VAVGRLQDFLGVQVVAVQREVQAALERQAKEIMVAALVAASSQVAEGVELTQLVAQEAHQPVVVVQDYPLVSLAVLLATQVVEGEGVLVVLPGVLAVQVAVETVLAIQLLVQQAPPIQAAVAVAEVKLAERLMAVRVLS
jgi:hypothetical protein